MSENPAITVQLDRELQSSAVPPEREIPRNGDTYEGGEEAEYRIARSDVLELMANDQLQ